MFSARRHVSRAIVLVALVFGSVMLLPAAERRAAIGPAAASPGSADGRSLAKHCATFSWGLVEGAREYELVVYRLGDEAGSDAEPQAVVSQRISAGVTSWTPPLERCPARGERFAWSVRAITSKGDSEWSAPLFFEVESQLSEEELALAIDILRQRAAGTTSDAGFVSTVSPGDADPRAIASIEPQSPQSPRSSGDGDGDGHVRTGSAVAVVNATASLKVLGEVRTLDPNDPAGLPRVWGSGRVDALLYVEEVLGVPVVCSQGGVSYGLSVVIVDWGSAADACPAGTWVCREAEVAGSECDTTRPDEMTGRTCNGDTFSFGSAQYGWTADRASGGGGRVVTESGAVLTSPTCNSFPVWCCWG